MHNLPVQRFLDYAGSSPGNCWYSSIAKVIDTHVKDGRMSLSELQLKGTGPVNHQDVRAAVTKFMESVKETQAQHMVNVDAKLDLWKAELEASVKSVRKELHDFQKAKELELEELKVLKACDVGQRTPGNFLAHLNKNQKILCELGIADKEGTIQHPDLVFCSNEKGLFTKANIFCELLFSCLVP